MRISVLGPLLVRRDDKIIDVGGAKQQLVLTSLVLAKTRVVSTDRLVETIWGDRPPSKPYDTLRAYVSHLRRVLEPEQAAGKRSGLLITRSPGYALEVEPRAVDAFDFEERLSTASDLLGEELAPEALTAIESALDLWRSEDLLDSPLLDFTVERDRLLELRRQALALRFDALLAAGRHEEAIADLRGIVETEPLRERSRYQLMLALYRSGRSAEAVEVYQDGYRVTVEATGIDPTPVLQELEAKILNADPSLDWVSAAARKAALPVVGRMGEAQRARAALFPPDGNLLVINGEPGIGKTHLVRHLVEGSSAEEITVAWAHGHQGSGAMTLAPWRSLLQRLIDEVDDEELLRLLGRRSEVLARLLPDVGERLDVESGGPADPLSLHEAIVHLLKGLASRKPLLLCFDDLHWFDVESARLLAFVAPLVKGRPIAMIATWRDTESIADELTAALVELGRQGAEHRLKLSGLSVSAVADLWLDLKGESPTPSGVETLHTRCGGNPLFITELLRASIDTGVMMPSVTVHEVIAARVANLPDGCAELLTICALCPDGAREWLLGAVSGHGDRELGSEIRALVSSGLVVTGPSALPSLRVAHAIVAESLTRELSSTDEASLHNRIAKALRPHDVPAGRLAHHLLRGSTVAAEPILAATSALDAARQSSRLHDHLGAIDLIERGLVALGRSDDDLLRAELLTALAQERKHLAHYAQAHAAGEEAFRLAKRAGDATLMLTAALVYCGQGIEEEQFGAQWLGYWNPPKPALEMLDACLEKLEPGWSRVVCLVAFASQLFGDFHDPVRARELYDEALEGARTLSDPTWLWSVLRYRLVGLERELSLEERRAIVDEGAALLEPGEDLRRSLVGLRHEVVLSLDEQDLESVESGVRRSEALAQRLGDPTQEMLAISLAVAVDLYQGHFDRAQEALDEALMRYGRLGSAALDIFGIQLAVLHRERGAHPDVAAMLEWKVSGYPGPAYAVPLALVLLEQGETDRAREVLKEYSDDSTALRGEAVLQFMTPAFLAEIASGLRDEALAGRVYRALLPAAERTVVLLGGIAMLGSGSYYLGRLATTLGRLDEAEEHLRAAERLHRSAQSAPYLLRTDLALADLAFRRGRREDEQELLGSAGDRARPLGMQWLVDAYGRHRGT